MAGPHDFTAVRWRLFQLHAAGDYATSLELARSAARDFFGFNNRKGARHADASASPTRFVGCR